MSKYAEAPINPLNSSNAMNNHQKSTNTAARSTVGEEEALENACRIWFEAPEGRVARELQALPGPEREQVWADMTANGEISSFHVPEEDPARVEASLISLQRELLVFARNDPSKALSTAMMTCPNYIFDQKFMLKFLRAQLFHTPGTIALMARHFEMKRELFGPKRLGRDITFDDLDHQDVHILTNGAYRYLEGTDRAGRFITFLDFRNKSFRNSGDSERRSLLRAVFYWNMAAAESEMVQRLGIVRVAYFHDAYPTGGPDQELIRLCASIIEAVPIKSTAMYLVSGSSLWSSTVEFLLFILSSFVRVRTRVISGSYYENTYSLMCLGIPSNIIPVMEDGNVRQDDVLRFIGQRKALEAQRKGQ